MSITNGNIIAYSAALLHSAIMTKKLPHAKNVGEVGYVNMATERIVAFSALHTNVSTVTSNIHVRTVYRTSSANMGNTKRGARSVMEAISVLMENQNTVPAASAGRSLFWK